MRSIMAFVAHMEREFIRQRTKAALQRRQRNFRWLEVFDRHGVEIAQKYTSGASLRQLSREYNIDIKAVKRILTRLGIYRPRESICPRCFSRMAVVSRDFDIAQRVIKTRYYCPNCGWETVVETHA
jgi:DNA invertase Pin-like site-specific DNA recombinase